MGRSLISEQTNKQAGGRALPAPSYRWTRKRWALLCGLRKCMRSIRSKWWQSGSRSWSFVKEWWLYVCCLCVVVVVGE